MPDSRKPSNGFLMKRGNSLPVLASALVMKPGAGLKLVFNGQARSRRVEPPSEQALGRFKGGLQGALKQPMKAEADCGLAALQPLR